MVTNPQYNEPLPQCEGPKLRPFDDPKPAVTFRRLLSDKDSEGHAHVFEAAIGSTAYALKMVWHHSYQAPNLSAAEGVLMP